MKELIKSFLSFWLTSLVLMGIIITVMFAIGAPMIPFASIRNVPEFDNTSTSYFFAIAITIIILLGVAFYLIRRLLKASHNIFALFSSVGFIGYIIYLADKGSRVFYGFDFNNYLVPIIILCSSIIFVFISNLSYLNSIRLPNFLKSFLYAFTPLVFGIFLTFFYILFIRDYSSFSNVTSNHFFKQNYFNNKELITCRLLYEKKSGYAENNKLEKMELFNNELDYVADIEKIRKEWKEKGYSGEVDKVLNHDVYLMYELFSDHDYPTHIYIVYETYDAQKYEFKVIKNNKNIINAKSKLKFTDIMLDFERVSNLEYDQNTKMLNIKSKDFVERINFDKHHIKDWQADFYKSLKFQGKPDLIKKEQFTCSSETIEKLS